MMITIMVYRHMEVNVTLQWDKNLSDNFYNIPIMDNRHDTRNDDCNMNWLMTEL